MFKYIIYAVLLTTLLSCDNTGDVKKEFVITKDNEVVKKIPQKKMKVKVKRNEKGLYSWELTGDDIGEILRGNKVLEREFLKKDSE